MSNSIKEVRETLQRFQEGYALRDRSKLDDFMELFVESDEIELIGIGASKRGGNEWFQGWEQVRYIVDGDWQYWGDVVLDVDGAKITAVGDVAWLSTSGSVVQTQTFDKALLHYLDQMKELLEDDKMDPDARLMEATHFGMRRLRERQKGMKHAWTFTLTAVLLKTGEAWRFHTIHWAMPVD